MNDETFEERYTLRLSRLNLFTAAALLLIATLILALFLIAFTPLKEYIPGYSSDFTLRRKLISMSEKVDSLNAVAKANDLLLEGIRGVISGKPVPQPANTRSGSKADVNNLKLTPSEKEEAFRKDVEEKDRYNLNQSGVSTERMTALGNYYFFPPMKGKVTNSFNLGERHYGIDVVAPKNEAVKATLDGVVTFSGWTSETGYVIQVQHGNNLLSIYKHNSVLLKKEGEKVKAGEAIAITGNSGELSTSPHLHFELWYEGKPIDPQDYMVF